MTQPTPQQFEDLGAIKENVRFNEKAIDELKHDMRGIRADIKALDAKLEAKINALSKDMDSKINALSKDMDSKITALSEQYQSLGWKGLVGIVIIVLANVILKYIPS